MSHVSHDASLHPIPWKPPLTGFGDPISIGDWVFMRDLQAGGRRSTTALRVEDYVLDARDPQIQLSNHLVEVSAWYHRPCSPAEMWKVFERVEEAQVPAYLREGLPVDPALLQTWYQLSKWQLLERFYERSEATLYQILSRQVPGSTRAPLPLRHELAPVSLTWKQIGQRRRKTLTLITPTYWPSVLGLWGGSERSLRADGTCIQGAFRLAWYASGGQGEHLSSALARIGASGQPREPGGSVTPFAGEIGREGANDEG